jgi:hypothetical protein
VRREILEELRAFFDAELGTYAFDNSKNKASSSAFNYLRDKRGFLSALESLVAKGVLCVEPKDPNQRDLKSGYGVRAFCVSLKAHIPSTAITNYATVSYHNLWMRCKNLTLYYKTVIIMNTFHDTRWVLRIDAEALPMQLLAWGEDDAERENMEAGAAAVMVRERLKSLNLSYVFILLVTFTCQNHCIMLYAFYISSQYHTLLYVLVGCPCLGRSAQPCE